MAAAIALSGCQSLGTKEGIGLGVGGLAGGAGGAAIGCMLGKLGCIAGAVVGALGGAVIGSEIGSYMDARDKELAVGALQQAATQPVGSVVQWSNPKTPAGGTGNTGSFMVTGQESLPPATGSARNGASAATGTCKTFSQEYVVDGKKTSSSMKACNSPPSKEWQIVG